MPEDKRLPGPDALELLNQGSIEVVGRMPYSSNATLLVEISLDGQSINAIYKPQRGERPLWDFPDGLYRREAAAYVLSAALGWELIPPTVVRVDAPYGVGSFQLFIDADFEQHYFSLCQRPDFARTFIKFAAFDIVANNADRKSGHILIDEPGRLWGIDNGLTFHAEAKLRTVIWEFGDAELLASELEDISRVARNAEVIFSDLLSEAEIEALARRSTALVKKAKLPVLDPQSRSYPWPLV